ncbi:site-specific integrase [Falsirhodobacter halotolerans]|nr:site-specific integrase [Falsirhodobacter halotolerans]MCJ8139935.1 site-specific integrase [Falsirhodobacter halotolerans]
MLDQIHDEILTPAEASAWLRHVVTEEMARARKNRDIIFADGGADARADWAMATAWRMLARRSVNAELEDEDIEELQRQGRSAADVHQLDVTLDMLGQEVRSEPRIRKMARAFRDLTGRGDAHIPVPMLLQLRKLFVEGRAAAWEKMPEDQGMSIASELAASLAEDIVRSERDTFLDAVKPWDGVMRAAEPVVPAPIVPDDGMELVSAPCVTPVPESAASATDHRHALPPTVLDLSEPGFDPEISSVIDRLVAQKARANVSSVTLQQYRTFGALFMRVTGVADVRGIRKHHVARFRDVLQRMPKSWGKSPGDANATVEDMLAKARTLPKDRVGLAPSTINRHLENLKHLLEHASDEGIHIDEKVKPARLRLAEEKRERDKRSSFRRAELEALFQHTIWQGCKSHARRNHFGTEIITDGLYWVPILAAYTGARREELAALTVRDVQVEDGVHFLNLAENDNRGLKNFSSVRRVPLHDRVLALGFMDHVQKARRRGKDVFPELRPMKHSKDDRSKKFGDRMYYAFGKALEHIFEGNPRKLCLHSMRHYVRDQLALDTTIAEKVRYDLIGHEMSDVDSRTYGEASPLQALHQAINKLPVVI